MFISHPGFKGFVRGVGLGVLARALSASCLDRWLLGRLRRHHDNKYIRVINYHGTPVKDRNQLAKQFAFYERNFSSVSLPEIKSFLSDGVWEKGKPGLIVSFDDGLRSNFDVARPLLEESGFVGWFFVPNAFINCPPERQNEFARKHQIQTDRESQPANERIAMTWEEVKQLTRNHVVGCHTHSHRRLGNLTTEQFKEEIPVAKSVLENKIESKVESFCWVGGELGSYSKEAAQIIENSGFELSFMTVSEPVTANTNPHQIQRTNVESHWPLPFVKFQLSGILDRLYASKRRSVIAKIQVESVRAESKS